MLGPVGLRSAMLGQKSHHSLHAQFSKTMHAFMRLSNLAITIQESNKNKHSLIEEVLTGREIKLSDIKKL